jgi:hypothetical protein
MGIWKILNGMVGDITEKPLGTLIWTGAHLWSIFATFTLETAVVDIYGNSESEIARPVAIL